MQTNINQNKLDKEDIKKVEEALEVTAIKASKVPDAKNIFKSEAREKAFKKRYGKDVRITITYEMNGNKLKELTQRFQDSNNKVYSITEYFTEQEATDYCILCCRRANRNFDYKFDRFLDAEVMLADLIAGDD